MTVTVTITTTSDGLALTAPYDPRFPARAKKIGGRFVNRVWLFDPRDEQAVRELAREFWGTDGSDSSEPSVTVRVPVRASDGGPSFDEYRAGGLRLVWRPGRDLPVKYAANVVLISGDFPNSAGSMRYPELAPYPDTVIEVRDVPHGTAEKIVKQVNGATIVDPGADRRAQLETERARLVARVAEIDALLEHEGS